MKHDTQAAYQNHGCRCPVCRERWRLYSKRRREGRLTPGMVPSTGARRRLRALSWLGWPQQLLADEMGVTASQFTRIVSGRRMILQVKTHRTVCRAFEERHLTWGPSKRAAALARRKNWAGPWAWDNIDNPQEHPKGVGGAQAYLVEHKAMLRLARWQVERGLPPSGVSDRAREEAER